MEDKNVYIKPHTSWNGELKYYVGRQPSRPHADPCSRLGSYFNIVDRFFSAQCIAEQEAKRLGGSVIVCDHYSNEWSGY